MYNNNADNTNHNHNRSITINTNAEVTVRNISQAALPTSANALY